MRHSGEALRTAARIVASYNPTAKELEQRQASGKEWYVGARPGNWGVHVRETWHDPSAQPLLIPTLVLDLHWQSARPGELRSDLRDNAGQPRSAVLRVTCDHLDFRDRRVLEGAYDIEQDGTLRPKDELVEHWFEEVRDRRSRSWREVGRRLEKYVNPGIRYRVGASEQEIAAHLAVWAIRRMDPEFHSGFVQVLEQYIQRLFRDATSEEISGLVWDTVNRFGPARTVDSFNVFLRRTLTGVRRTEDQREKRVAGREYNGPEMSEPQSGSNWPDRITVPQAALLLQQRVRSPASVDSLCTFLYRYLRAGDIPGDVRTETRKRISPLGIASSHRVQHYEIRRSDLAEIATIYDGTKGRPALVKQVATARGVSVQAARAWVRRREQRGRSLREIWKELRATS